MAWFISKLLFKKSRIKSKPHIYFDRRYKAWVVTWEFDSKLRYPAHWWAAQDFTAALNDKLFKSK